VIGLSLLLIPGVLFADSRTLAVDDVLRLHFAGVSDEVIISEIIVTNSVFQLDVDDILRLTEAGLSERLLKFMIDTGLPDRAAAEEVPEALPEEEGYAEDEYGETWANLIEEEPAETTTFIASLNYNYGGWWYDNYWYDYWYYDFDYAPYHSSYVYSIGVWYPTWYSYWHCYAPPYYAYHSWYWYRHGYPYGHGGWWDPYYCYNDPYYYYDDDYRHGGGYHYPSQVKYKKGSSSGGKIVAGGGKLKMNDGSRVKATRHGQKYAGGVRKDRRGDVLVADVKKPGDRVRRPIKSAPGGPRLVDDRGGGEKVRSGEGRDRMSDRKRTPVRGVHAPASGRPTKVRVNKRPTAVKSIPDRAEDPPRKPSAEASKAPSKSKSPSKPVVKSPEKTQAAPPSVKPKPAKPKSQPSSGVKPSKPRGSAPKAVRSAPRSAPKKA
jgi:hypothetical protein